MLNKCLKIINLSVTEDYYDYKGTFTLHDGEKYLDAELDDLDSGQIGRIIDYFGLQGTRQEIREGIMALIMEAARVECRNVEGEDLK